jgi:rhamnogalacturonan acetylesterase
VVFLSAVRVSLSRCVRRADETLASLTPDNIWNGTTIAAGGRFVTYAQSVGTDTGITYVDHFDYTAQAYNKLGETTVNTFYTTADHLHTLKNFVNAAGKAVPSAFLGSEKDM